MLLFSHDNRKSQTHREVRTESHGSYKDRQATCIQLHIHFSLIILLTLHIYWICLFYGDHIPA